jgi:hypothetical protein
VSTPRPARRLRRLAALAALPVLLSGCGEAQPGAAALVGDEMITVSAVDEESALICQAVEADLEQPLPMSLARYQILTGQISRAIADQIGEEYDVEPGSEYETAVAQAQAQVSAYPAATRATLVEVSTTQTYVQSIISSAARLALAEEGVTSPSDAEVGERSQDIFATWPDSHRLEIDPRFRIEFVDGNYVRADTGVSFPVSETAVAGQAEEPDPAVTALMPVSQRCG